MRPMLSGVHHIALICSNYERSKAFYIDTLGLQVIAEHYRQNRRSWKLDLRLPDGCQLELFSFPDAPARCSQPEAQGLRHLAFAVNNINEWVQYLENTGVKTEPIRIDEYTGKHFTFFKDPDGLPLELYQR